MHKLTITNKSLQMRKTNKPDEGEEEKGTKTCLKNRRSQMAPHQTPLSRHNDLTAKKGTIGMICHGLRRAGIRGTNA